MLLIKLRVDVVSGESQSLITIVFTALVSMCSVLDLFQQRVAPFYRGFLPLFQQRVAPFYRTLTTTTDQQTGFLAGSDRLVLGMR